MTAEWINKFVHYMYSLCKVPEQINGLVQDCSNSSELAMKLLIDDSFHKLSDILLQDMKQDLINATLQ